jgi:hypothetical protein
MGYQDLTSVFRAITTDGFNSGNPLTNVRFQKVIVDGSNMTQSSGYTSATKAFHFTWMVGVHFIECQALNCPATGFGTDFAVSDVVFRDCVATGNGRLAVGNSPGASGIGIGTAGTTDCGTDRHHRLLRHRQLPVSDLRRGSDRERRQRCGDDGRPDHRQLLLGRSGRHRQLR